MVNTKRLKTFDCRLGLAGMLLNGYPRRWRLRRRYWVPRVSFRIVANSQIWPGEPIATGGECRRAVRTAQRGAVKGYPRVIQTIDAGGRGTRRAACPSGRCAVGPI